MTFIKDISKFQAPINGAVHVIQPGRFIDIDDKYYIQHKEPKKHMRTGKLQPQGHTVNYNYSGFVKKTSSFDPSYKNYGSYLYDPVNGTDFAHK